MDSRSRSRSIREMFAAVARRYDLLNHLLSAGLDRRWRARAAAALRHKATSPTGGCGTAGLPGREECPADTTTAGQAGRATSPLIVDVCTGTGDQAMAVLRQVRGSRVIGCDFCRPMLERARAKFDRAGLAGRATLLETDALALPLADGSVDAATCAFGVRNTDDPDRCLAEMVRVVRPGGRVVILEFHWPQGLGALGGAFGLYFRRILPRLGAWISGGDRGGYAYLVDSIDAFGPPRRTARRLREAGLAEVRAQPLTGGVASVFTGRKPG